MFKLLINKLPILLVFGLLLTLIFPSGYFTQLSVISSADEPDSPQITDTYEPNDSQSVAQSVYYNSTFDSYISRSDDQDWFTFTAAEAGISKVTLDVPEDTDFDVELRDSDGNLVSSGTRGEGIDESVQALVIPSEVYFIHIFSKHSTDFSDQPYHFTLTQTSYETYEPNPSPSSSYPVQINNTYSSYISSVNDEDWYKLTPVQSGIAHVRLQVPASVDYDIEVVDVDGTVMDEGSTGQGSEETLSLYVESSHVYYFHVFGAHDEDYGAEPYN